MVIENIKTKIWHKKDKENTVITTGKKIIIYTYESQSQGFSINEMEKIREFFKNLRS
jgi:hypothetical protein